MCLRDVRFGALPASGNGVLDTLGQIGQRQQNHQRDEHEDEAIVARRPVRFGTDFRETGIWFVHGKVASGEGNVRAIARRPACYYSRLCRRANEARRKEGLNQSNTNKRVHGVLGQRGTLILRLCSGWQHLRRILGQRVSGGSLAVARMATGGVLALEAFSLLKPRPQGSWLWAFYTGSHVRWRVPYAFLEGLPVWPEPLMSLQVLLMGLAGVALALGVWSRLAATIGLAGWAHICLLEEAQYNNHYYLLGLLLLVICVSPAECWAGGARHFRALRRGTPVGSTSVPFWPLALLRGQMFLVYFFGGVAKLSGEYLLAAEPVASSLREPTLLASVSAWLTADSLDAARKFLGQEWLAYAMAYAGLVFDLSIGFLLLMRRTRLFGFGLVLLFHLLNPLLLFRDIGWFPVLGVALTTVFFDPDWPERVARWFRGRTFPRPDWGMAGGRRNPNSYRGRPSGLEGRAYGPTWSVGRDELSSAGGGVRPWSGW